MSNSKDIDVKNALDVIQNTNYLELCDNLRPLFLLSRIVSPNDSYSIYALQEGVTNIVLKLQDIKKEYKKKGDERSVIAVNRLLKIIKNISDAIAWRVFNYDRVILQLLSEHNRTGNLDSTVVTDLAEAKKIIDSENSVVLVNDLTTILRYGDLTIFDGKSISFKENKTGKGSKKSGRAGRQRHNLDAITDFMNSGVRQKDNVTELIFRLAPPITTYHNEIEIAINQALKNGYYQKQVSECFAVETIWLNTPQLEIPEKKPFSDIQYYAHQDSLTLFDQPITKIAPFGIFPLSDLNCFYLTTGEVVVRTYVNLEALKELYSKRGISFDISFPSLEQRNSYLNSSIGEKKKILNSGDLSDVISKGNISYAASYIYLIRMLSEYFDEKTIVQLDEDLISIFNSLSLPEDLPIRVYTGYTNENLIWM